MNTLAIGLIIISGLVHLTKDLFIKRAQEKEIFVTLYLISALIISLPYSLYFLSQETFQLHDLFLVIPSGLVHGLYIISMAKAYKTGDLSHIYPIVRCSPIFVLILATIFLNEQISQLAIIGILITTFGIYIINAKSLHPKTLLEPLRSIKNEPASRLALLALAMSSSYFIIDKLGVTRFHPFSYIAMIQFFTLIFVVPYILQKYHTSQIKTEWQNNKKQILTAGVFDLISYSTGLMAVALATVSQVATLRQFTVVLAVIIGHKILKEAHIKIRLLASAIIIAGLILVSLN